MKLATSRLTSQGQISVPADIRRRLGLGPGSVLEWNVEGDKVVVRRAGKYTSLDIHHVLFPKRSPKRRTIEEMDAGIRRAVGKRASRARR